MNRAPLPRRPSVALVAAIVAQIALVPTAARAAGGFGLDKVGEQATKLAASTSPPTGRERARLAAEDQLRPVARHPLPARARRSGATTKLPLPGAVLPSRAVLRSDRRGATWSTARSVTPVAFSPSHVRLREERLREPRAAGPRLRRLPRALRRSRRGLLRRGDRLPRRQLLPRASARDQVFGLSARGLAIDTAESWGEEFPWFREFWLVTPAPNAKELTIYALLDSPRVTGAYRFAVEPGEQTRVDVECRLFLREGDPEARHRAAHQHVLPRREHAASLRRLPPRGARLGRAAPQLRRRASGSGGRSTTRRTLRVSGFADGEPAGLRPAPARPRLRPLPGPRDACRAPPERLGRAGGRLGRRPRRAGRDPDQRGHQRQRRRLLGAGAAGRSRASRSRSPTRCTGTATTRRGPPGGRVVATRRDARDDRGRAALRHRLRRRRSSARPAGRPGAARRGDGRRRRRDGASSSTSTW